MKLVLHSGDIVNVYSVDGLPMVIETDKGLVPTVCALWKVPDLVPVLAIHTPVLPKVFILKTNFTVTDLLKTSQEYVSIQPEYLKCHKMYRKV